MLDEILYPLDLSDFEVCVECIKGKQTNIRKLGAERAYDVLELINMDIWGFFPTASWNGKLINIKFTGFSYAFCDVYFDILVNFGPCFESK